MIVALFILATAFLLWPRRIVHVHHEAAGFVPMRREASAPLPVSPHIPRRIRPPMFYDQMCRRWVCSGCGGRESDEMRAARPVVEHRCPCEEWQ